MPGLAGLKTPATLQSPMTYRAEESLMCLPVILLTMAILSQDKPPEPVLVKKVLSVTLTTDKGALTVMAVGEVPTGGYTRSTLARVTYIKQPEDGIQDYTLRATPPAGPATQV